jgi:dienelactone hydrolase
MKRTLGTVPALLLLAALLPAAEPERTRVMKVGLLPDDHRLGRPRDIYDKYHPMKVPATKGEWEKRRKELREQVLVAAGLWPLPKKTPLKAVIHGKIERDGYTIEKVFFASLPGHYVSGNLYRPKGKSGKLPAVLTPHGHWQNERFYDAGEGPAREQMRKKAERTMESARFPFQGRSAQLARMGCVVFHYDMVGSADSKKIKHRTGFTDPDAELRLQSFLGLQTWNGIRALDFVLSLPDVDPKRVAVTGASGGGTQTFLLAAVDDRVAAAFPAVMVSTAMQGGCVCENASYLRQGTNNVELAALLAPKPLGMTGANDWTIDIEKKGLPELKTIYKFYGAEDRVMAKCFPQFEHNYNQVSREVMYTWFNKHLRLGQPEPVVEKDFVHVPPRELSVYDKEHPLPSDAVTASGLREYLTEASDKQMAALWPGDEKKLKEFRRVVGTALRVMIHDRLPGRGEVVVKEHGSFGPSKEVGYEFHKLTLGRKGQKEELPAVLVVPPDYKGSVVVWIDPRGKRSLLEGDRLAPAARAALKAKAAILAVDVFMTGEFADADPPRVNSQFAGFTFCYNRPLLAERVHDILTAVAYARGLKGTKAVHLAGFGKAGPWVVLARAAAGDAVARTATDLNGFRFDTIWATTDEMLLPGAVKYGGLGAFAALCAPGELFVHNMRGTGIGQLSRAAYKAAGADAKLERSPNRVGADKVIAWLLR